MALFEKVNYQYYTETLGRHKVPTAEEFDAYKLQNELFIKSLINEHLIIERELNGIDSACCMMIEEDYTAAQLAAGNSGAIVSESIGGYSYNRSSKAADIAAEKDAKSTSEKKYKWLSMFCDITNGVR